METLDLTTIKDIVAEFTEEVKNALKNNASNASGALSKSIKGIVKMNGKYLTVSLSMEDYWKYIEYGTKPHFPPVDKIKSWITVKPILPRPLANGKLPTENQLAFLIGRKISRAGTKPKPFVYNTLENFNLLGKVYDETLRLVTEQIQKQITESI